MKSFFYVLLLPVLFFACSPNNVTKDDSLKKYFDENNTEGCFALMDNGTGQFTVFNLSRYFDSSYLPASTFKIVNSLIGLQTGKISNDSMVIKWDGIKRPFDSWNKDLSMYEAFRVSSVPYYQEVARRIGKDTMQRYLNSLGYGAKTDTDKVVITSPIDTFWLDNSITITPDQQLGLMKKLYFNQLPGFFKSNQEIVKRAMLMESTPDYRLGYKTGWSFWNEKTGKQLAWMLGWIEENNHPYFFVLNFETKDKNADIPAIRIEMLKDILKQLGFFKGKM
ncbi:MAG TPA: penicillin-binding transpeptidase domain-containing protein [Chitinophagaceae bacterium]